MVKAVVLALVVFAFKPLVPRGLDVFAPGTISARTSHDDYLSLSPDGQTAIFTRLGDGYRGGTLYFADRIDGRWQNVRVAPFSGEHQDSRASFSPDGRRIVFASNRPGPGRAERTDLDLWYVERHEDAWSEPVPVGAPVNTTAHETHPSLAASGALYFVRRTQDSDIWMARVTATGWADPVRLPDTVNSARPDSHVFVDPDERFLLFAREEPGAGDDVYVSVRREGEWAEAVNAGAPINTRHDDYSAKVYGSPARVYFTRNGHWTGGGPADIHVLPLAAIPVLTAAGVGR